MSFVALGVLAITAHAQVSIGIDSGFQYSPSISWSVLDEGQRCEIDEPGIFIISTEGDWQTYWSRATGREAYLAPTRVADWTREQIIAIHLGTGEFSTSSVFVESIERPDPFYWQVNYAITDPIVVIRGGGTSPVRPNSPYVLIRVQWRNGVPNFNGRRVKSRWGYQNDDDCHRPCPNQVWYFYGGQLRPYVPPGTDGNGSGVIGGGGTLGDGQSGGSGGSVGGGGTLGGGSGGSGGLNDTGGGKGG